MPGAVPSASRDSAFMANMICTVLISSYVFI
jgi:hypothetical protein